MLHKLKAYYHLRKWRKELHAGTEVIVKDGTSIKPARILHKKDNYVTVINDELKTAAYMLSCIFPKEQ